MEDSVQRSVLSIAMFVIIGLFIFTCLLTLYCIIRAAGLGFSDILPGGAGESSSSPAVTAAEDPAAADSSAAIEAALPVVVSYGGVAKQLIRNAAECAICLSEFVVEEEEIVKMMPRCRHVFHVDCIDTWLSSHVSCPICRDAQFFKVVDEQVQVDV